MESEGAVHGVVSKGVVSKDGVFALLSYLSVVTVPDRLLQR